MKRSYPLIHSLSAQKLAYQEDPIPSYEARLLDLQSLRRMLRTHQEEIIAAINADYGHRSRHETQFTEIAQVLSAIRHVSAHLKKWMRPQKRSVDRLSYGIVKNRIIPQPLGVVGVIVPWNFPINLSFIPLVYIFSAGNRAMVKMSENSRHLAQLLIKISPSYFPVEKLLWIDETGEVGKEFSQLPFDHLLFTGSGNTGRAVMRAAAENLCPVTLELGGKCPAIILPDYDIPTAMGRILWAKCLNAGQICTSVDYVFVPREKMAEAVNSAKVIVPTRYKDIHSEDYTSIINASAYDRLKKLLNNARELGAEVIPLMSGASMDDDSHRLVPHVVVNPPLHSELMQQEIFGPILPMIPYDNINEVLANINAGSRPLAIYPFGHSSTTINHILSHTMTGGVSVNDALLHVAQDDLPFGGVGASGMGHYHGVEGFMTFSKLRPIFYQSKWTLANLINPPYTRWTEKLFAWLLR